MSEKKPLQQGVEDSRQEDCDIMVIDRTRMGESTTMDKLLLASCAGS